MLAVAIRHAYCSLGRQGPPRPHIPHESLGLPEQRLARALPLLAPSHPGIRAAGSQGNAVKKPHAGAGAARLTPNPIPAPAGGKGGCSTRKLGIRLVVVERYQKEKSLPPLSRTKFLVSQDLTRLCLASSQTFYLLVNNRGLPNMTATMQELYRDHKDEDGFLYLTYASQEVFGSCFSSGRSAASCLTMPRPSGCASCCGEVRNASPSAAGRCPRPAGRRARLPSPEAWLDQTSPPL
uniref:Microtubule-associated proteins 1A/1B light chain 3C n=1 Tax=Apteryx owenii TaxID=8824 RepID=A0A8B9QEP3_APTOW